MKKMILPLVGIGLAFLTLENLEAGKQKHVAGVALVDFSNAAALNPFLLQPLPAFLSGSAFSVSPREGNCFTTEGVCLTIRDINEFQRIATSNCCETGVFNNFVEIIAQFHVTFANPFKCPPAVNVDLQILTPMGTGCPLVNGGTILCQEVVGGCTPLGYINDVTIFLTDVTTTGFTINLDLKVALASFTQPGTGNNLAVLVAQGLISRGILLHFDAVSTKNK